MRLVGGANLPRVSIKDLLSLSLPLPPESERERLNELARSMARLRARQRDLDGAVLAAERAATASALGLGPAAPGEPDALGDRRTLSRAERPSVRPRAT
jgi:hypothetical protein